MATHKGQPFKKLRFALFGQLYSIGSRWPLQVSSANILLTSKTGAGHTLQGWLGKRVQRAARQKGLLQQALLSAGGAACVRGSERDRERAQASGSMWGAQPRRQAERGYPSGVGGRPARGLRQQTQASEGEADAQRSPRRGVAALCAGGPRAGLRPALESRRDGRRVPSGRRGVQPRQCCEVADRRPTEGRQNGASWYSQNVHSALLIL